MVGNPKVDSKVVFVGRVHPKPQKMVETCIGLVVSWVLTPVVLVVSVVVGDDNVVVVHKTVLVVR